MGISDQTSDGLKRKISKALEIIDCWCMSIGLNISSPKSQVMNIGREKFKELILINEEAVLTGEMKWRGQFKLIDEKISKFIRVDNLLKYMNRDMKLKQKKDLYKQVCISIIGYAAKVWLPDLKFDYQHKA